MNKQNHAKKKKKQTTLRNIKAPSNNQVATSQRGKSG